MEEIKVLLVDDHTIVRQGLRLLLDTQPDINIVGETGDGREAVEMTRELMPDVILMDISMPGMNGLEASRRIKDCCPNSRILALTMHDNEEYFFQALSAGAAGYILKKADPAELVNAIRVVHQGGAFLYPSVAKSLVADFLRRVDTGEEKASFDGLTEREREILKLVAEGKTNREIASMLLISTKTADRHRANLMEKLHVHNRSQLIKYAIRKGVIDVDT
ncbi:MAG: response regulator transcription factor [Chloroflexi bacterium]|nr:response regulator transcription factor [Chloroflexota bacterium]